MKSLALDPFKVTTKKEGEKADLASRDPSSSQNGRLAKMTDTKNFDDIRFDPISSF